MADFFEQHRLNLRGGGALKPVVVEIDAFATYGSGIGVGAVNAAEGGAT